MEEPSARSYAYSKFISLIAGITDKLGNKYDASDYDIEREIEDKDQCKRCLGHGCDYCLTDGY